ncbi:hypothetical protein FHU36_003709 [Nonomuraea muscovyensis]|uniref:Uncharacterized protein n=1 Tax=Nonomuraea muscovyensis TaxID=1124761 RepID=A0A7X0EZ57_9ACTN|nr:hypothetical protein [Nonomuraea muscovyensis]MBB6347164.1 hypothetical protein [Nonomuraea muscovyensis]
MGHDPTAYAPKPRVTVPTAVLLAKDDVTIRRSAERDADSAGPDRGGAYLALEVPDLLVADVRAFFGAKRVCQAGLPGLGSVIPAAGDLLVEDDAVAVGVEHASFRSRAEMRAFAMRCGMARSRRL